MKVLMAGFLTGLMVFSVISAAVSSGARGAAAGEAEEYDILSKLLRSEYGSDYELILIDAATENWRICSPLSVLFDQFSGLKQETIDSLIVRNSGAAAVLEKKFDLPAAYALVSGQQFMQALQDTANPNWDNFDAVYADAQGFLTFSRIGFDAAHTQALVIFSNAYRCSGTSVTPADRKIAYFSRQGGAWKLIGIAKGFQAR